MIARVTERDKLKWKGEIAQGSAEMRGLNSRNAEWIGVSAAACPVVYMYKVILRTTES